MTLFSSKIPRSNSSLVRAHSRGSFSRLVLESESSNGEYATSIPFFLCQMIVITFRSVTPISYLGLLAYFFLPVTPGHFGGPFQGQLAYWTCFAFMTAEALFFPVYLYIFTAMNQRNVELRHVARCTDSRMQLVEKCFNAMACAGKEGGLMDRSPERYLRRVLEGWHLDTPIGQIRRDNFGQWAAWAFWDKDLEDLLTSERKELNNIISFVEEKVDWKFEEGMNKRITSARLTLDPVFATQRPFFFYVTIWLVNTICHLFLYFILGFRLEPEHCSDGQSIYRRIGTGTMSTGKRRRLPVFVIHGLGIGYTHYLSVLARLPRDVDVYLLEWPHVCMQLTTKVPKMEETIRIVNSVLEAHGHEAACFLAHSLGTTVVSWMLHDEVGKNKVAATVLLDPVTFLLCDPTVATNVVYKPPSNTIDFLMHFFIARELFISNALSRHFNWSHNIMFVEELFQNKSAGPDGVNMSPRTRFKKGVGGGLRKTLDSSSADTYMSCSSGSHDGDDARPPRVNHSIILSSNDSIVPVGPVSRYLHQKSEEYSGSNKKPNFEVAMFHGYHGEMMLRPSWAKRIAGMVDSKL